MLTTTFPGTNLQPSVLSLGVAPFGSDISRDESFAMLDAYAEAGGNFADTAHIYAAWTAGGDGQSERTLGAWLADRRPQGFLVGTKGGHPVLGSADRALLAPTDLERHLHESMERLGLQTIDMYWLHRDDPQVPVAEVMDALNTHVRSGQVRYLGASNWSVQRIAQANAAASQRGWQGFAASQIAWSLAEFNPAPLNAMDCLCMDDETFAYHRASGLPIAAYSSQANGYFSYPLPAAGTEPTAKQKALAYNFGAPVNACRHARAQQLAKRLGRTANEVALAYLWGQTFPGVAIIGPRRLEQLRDSLRACDLRLRGEDVGFLEAG